MPGALDSPTSPRSESARLKCLEIVDFLDTGANALLSPHLLIRTTIREASVYVVCSIWSQKKILDISGYMHVLVSA